MEPFIPVLLVQVPTNSSQVCLVDSVQRHVHSLLQQGTKPLPTPPVFLPAEGPALGHPAGKHPETQLRILS